MYIIFNTLIINDSIMYNYVLLNEINKHYSL